MFIEFYVPSRQNAFFGTCHILKAGLSHYPTIRKDVQKYNYSLTNKNF